MLSTLQIEKTFGKGPHGRGVEKAVLQQKRKQSRLRAEELDNAAREAGRDFTEAEQKEYNGLLEVMQTANVLIERHEENATWDRPAFRAPIPLGSAERGNGNDDGGRGLPPEAHGFMAAITGWMRSGSLDYSAADTPLHISTAPISVGLADAIQVTILDALRSYTSVDAFRLAGATIYQTDDTTPLKKPIVSAGVAPDSFVEGQSATESHPFQVDSFTFGGIKFSRLVKASEESLMNSALDLGGEIMNELAAAVANGFTTTITAAMLAALQGNPACFVDNGADPYAALSGLIAAVPPRFEDPSNCFMGSRAAKLRITNSRDSQGRPLFLPDGSVLNRRWVTNDNLAPSSRVVYGSWPDGAFVRKSPFFLQRLIEKFSDEGAIGFKATQWLDSKFLASVHTVSVQPLYFTALEGEGS